MALTSEENNATYVIRRYQNGELLINDETYTESLFVYSSTLEKWPVANMTEIKSEHIDMLLAHQPEVIILGTGHKMHVPSRELIHQAGLQGIGIEFMNTEQACSTYNLLASDGRPVLGAFIINNA